MLIGFSDPPANLTAADQPQEAAGMKIVMKALLGLGLAAMVLAGAGEPGADQVGGSKSGSQVGGSKGASVLAARPNPGAVEGSGGGVVVGPVGG
jgi:hypothetical protein